MCQVGKTIISLEKGGFYSVSAGTAQGIAQFVRGLMRRFLLVGSWALLMSCAGQVRGTSQNGTLHAEAILASGKNLFVFDFTHSRYQKWPLPDGNLVKLPESLARACVLMDTLLGNWAEPSRWLALPAATQPFQPIQAISGPNGNFFLMDQANKRLALYDTNAQFVSGIPLPQEIRDRNLNKVQVFWTRDGLFSFLDLSEAKVWKYEELRSSGGSGVWQLRYTLNLPLGLNACLWEPYFNHPVCLRRGSRPMLFDDYFNLSSTAFQFEKGAGIRAKPETSGLNWRIYFYPDPQCPRAGAQFYSVLASGFFPDPDSLPPLPRLTPSQP